MNKSKIKMIEELKKLFVPEVRKMGFNGTFPHFRRTIYNKIDLLTIQFSTDGGCFFIEISYVMTKGENSNLIFKDRPLNIKNVSAWETSLRKRLSPKNGKEWFCYFDKIEQNILGRKFKTVINPDDREFYQTKKVKWIQKADDTIYFRLAAESVKYLDKAVNWWKKAPYKMRFRK